MQLPGSHISGQELSSYPACSQTRSSVGITTMSRLATRKTAPTPCWIFTKSFDPHRNPIQTNGQPAHLHLIPPAAGAHRLEVSHPLTHKASGKATPSHPTTSANDSISSNHTPNPKNAITYSSRAPHDLCIHQEF